MSHVRFLWPSVTVCTNPKCGSTLWWAVKTQASANMRKCRACGQWYRVEATHEEVMLPDGKSSVIRPVSQQSKQAAPARALRQPLAGGSRRRAT